MATVQIYPAPGASPIDEIGNPIPADGMAIYVNPYYQRLLDRGEVIRRDGRLSGVAQEVIYSRSVSSGLAGLLTNELAARPGLEEGECVTTVGRATGLDGGGASFRVALGVSSGANGVTKINGPNCQYQQVREFGPTTLEACGIPSTGDVTSALTALLAAATASNQNSHIQLATPGLYVGRTFREISNTVAVTGTGGCGELIGQGGTLAQGTTFVWTGPSNKPMFRLSTFGMALSKFGVQNAPGIVLHTAFAMSNTAGAGNCTENLFDHVSVGSDRTGGGYVGRAFTAEFTVAGPGGNVEDMRFRHCRMYDCEIAGAILGDLDLAPGSAFSPQPFNWNFDYCHFFRTGVGSPRSRGIIMNVNDSGNVTTRGCFFYNLAAQRWGFGNWLSLSDVSEQCKIIYWEPNGGTTAATFAMKGGRHAMNSLTLEATVPGELTYPTISASDYRFIAVGAGGQVSLENAIMAGNATDANAPGEIFTGPYGSIFAHGCTFPNVNVFNPAKGQFGTNLAGVFSFGNRSSAVQQGGGGAAAAAACTMPTLIGGLNQSSTVTFGAADVEKTITLSKREQNTDYFVQTEVVGITGTPAAGSLDVWFDESSRVETGGLASQFKLKVLAAPGGGASVTVRYWVRSF